MNFQPPPLEAQYLENLRQNASKYFNDLFDCASLHGTQWFTLTNGDRIYFLRMFYWDTRYGLKRRVLIIDDLGKNDVAIHVLAKFQFEDNEKISIVCQDNGEVPSDKMSLSPKVFIYTNKLYCPIEKIIDIFNKYQPDSFIEVIDESRMFKTLFISYGSPDETIAAKINSALKSKGVKTWFFPDDSLPGDKLHRMMSEGVYKHDHTLLICSENSIVRSGVLNEIERMLEREAKEGGREIIIPVSVDDYIFNGWEPDREDIRNQITSRVVRKIDDANFNTEIERIIKVLRKND